MKAIVSILCFLISSSLFADDIKALKARAEKGDAGAQTNLGLVYLDQKKYSKALTWLTKAAEQNFPSGQYNLGFMYAKGRGVEQDYKKAVERYTKAAEQGYAVAQFWLGVSCWTGEGTAKDMVKCLAWWILAAKQEYKNAIEWKPEAEAKMSLEKIAKAEALAKELQKQIEAKKKAEARKLAAQKEAEWKKNAAIRYWLNLSKLVRTSFGNLPKEYDAKRYLAAAKLFCNGVDRLSVQEVDVEAVNAALDLAAFYQNRMVELKLAEDEEIGDAIMAFGVGLLAGYTDNPLFY